MWCMAILLPTPREPECRNSQTCRFSSTVTSMKWLPDPSEPSCMRPARRVVGPGRTPPAAAAAVSASTRGAADSVIRALLWPADSGTARSIASRSADAVETVERVDVVLRPDRDHPAADVDPDRGGHDGAQRRDDAADRCALAQMGVRHQREVREDERHPRGHLRLGARLVLEDRCPGQQLGRELLHDSLCSVIACWLDRRRAASP